MTLTILHYVDQLLNFYSWLLIARILMSWVPDVENSKIGQILISITEPYLGLFRRFIPPLPLGGAYLDLSPIVAIFAFSFVRMGIMSVLVWLL
jgi:YggT family protein